MVLSNNKVQEIINFILHFYYINEEELFGKSRLAHIVEARQMLAYCLRKKMGFSYVSFKNLTQHSWREAPKMLC